MLALRVVGVFAALALLWAAGLGAYTDKIKEAARTDAELAAEAKTKVPPAGREIDAVTAEIEATRKEVEIKEKSRARWNALVVGLVVFVLAIFVGFEVIAKVPPTLHTPLMSGSNAISGITVVGAVTIAGFGFGGFWSGVGAFIGMIAVALATINVIGGFLVTHRMLAMFKRK